MEKKKLTSIGVLGSNKSNISYTLVKKIFQNSGYEIIMENEIVSILTNRDKFIIIFELTPAIVEKIMELNMLVDIIIHTSLRKEDYNNSSIKRIIRYAKYFIMNIDEEKAIELLSKNLSTVVITYGLNKKATVTTSSLVLFDNIQFSLCIQRELLNMEDQTVEPMEMLISTRLYGASKIYHALACITCLLVYGIELESMNKLFLNIKGVYRRLDKI